MFIFGLSFLVRVLNDTYVNRISRGMTKYQNMMYD